MDKAVHKTVRVRAGHRCEYCRFPEAFAELPFHLDHVIAQQHGGPTVLENLALACCYCNRYKGPNLSGIDPNSGEVVPLFHLLQINRADAVAVRRLLMQEGVFLPDPAAN